MGMSPVGLRPENGCAGDGPAAIVNDRFVLSSEKMLHKDYDRKCSVSAVTSSLAVAR
jgi:hypothetical protein